jgi:hypothetical protein
MAQANFEPTFSCINTLTILKTSYYSSYLPAYEDGTDSVFRNVKKNQTPENYPEENIQHSQHGESLKSRKIRYVYGIVTAKPRETKTARGAVKRTQMEYVSENQAVWIRT